jgi:hypothetical protein
MSTKKETTMEGCEKTEKKRYGPIKICTHHNPTDRYSVFITNRNID